MTTKEFSEVVDREELLRDLEDAPEPGTMSRGQIIHSGSGELPVAMVTQALQSAQYVYLWDTVTYERSICNRNMLRTNLRKRRKDGSFVFTPTDPKILPSRGILKCRLHGEHPDREKYAALGFPTCPKGNLRSQLDVRRHMQHRHKTEWATIEQDREDHERALDRQAQYGILKAVGGKLEETPFALTPTPAPVAEPVPEAEPVPAPEAEAEPEIGPVAETLFCECGKGFRHSKGKNNAKLRLTMHQRGAKHGEFEV
jgi:hypothetical protein